MTTPKRGPWQRFVRATKKPVWYAVHRLTGISMERPVQFWDMSMFGGEFRLGVEQAAQLVPDERFLASVREDGLARCQVIALEYMYADIMYPYNEVAVAIPGRMQGLDRDGELVCYIHLPVTSEDARWSGVEIYGFPKYLAAIEFEETEADVTCSLAVGGEEMLALQASQGETRKDEWVVENVTFLEGEPILSFFRCVGQRYASAAPGGAQLKLGPHRLAERLRAAEIELESVSHFHCPTMSATLSKPQRL